MYLFLLKLMAGCMQRFQTSANDYTVWILTSGFAIPPGTLHPPCSHSPQFQVPPLPLSFRLLLIPQYSQRVCCPPSLPATPLPHLPKSWLERPGGAEATRHSLLWSAASWHLLQAEPGGYHAALAVHVVLCAPPPSSYQAGGGKRCSGDILYGSAPCSI